MSVHIYTDSEDVGALTTAGSTNFHYSFSFLPREERKAINTVYAFCRRIDDIVDDLPSTNEADIRRKRERLDWWRRELDNVYAGRQHHALLLPLANVIRRFTIPRQYLFTIIDGCERDLFQHRYETFAELKEYCYAVASCVGLVCIEIFGYRYEETKQYAINLGYALQLTNILRDIKADKDRGYIYLPQEDLERFRYSEADLRAEIYDDRFVQLMEFQTRRAREYYHRARTMLRPDERLTMVAAEIMDGIYYRLLDKIELSGYRVYSRRVRVSAAHKVLTALRIWVNGKLFVRKR